MATIRKVVFHKHGDPIEVLNIEEGPCPQPGPGEVLVKVTKLPLNSGDFLMTNGLHNPIEFAVPKEGLTPGGEGVGIIEALGSGVDASRGLQVGTRVSFFVVGTWKEKLVLPADIVFPVPPAMDDDLASQLYVKPLVALLVVREVVGISKAGYRPAQVLRRSVNSMVVTDQEPTSKEPGVVILSGAASVTAKLMAAMLKEKGFTPIGMVRSRSAAAALHADTGVWTVSTEYSDWQAQIRKEVGNREIFAALDGVGGKISTEMLRLLSPGGTLISYGILSGEPCIIPQAPLTMENKIVRGVGMVHWSLLPFEARAKDLALLSEFLMRNRKLLPTKKEFKFSEMKTAVELFFQPGRDGIIMMVP